MNFSRLQTGGRAAVVLLLSALTAGTSLTALARPNILFLLADDARLDAFGFTGSKVAHTPNLDRLAAKGTVFRQSFVSTAICCVSRATIFSGQYERTHQITDFGTPFSAAAWRQTYPALLRANGYYTGMIGKFGVGDRAMPVEEFDFWRAEKGQLTYFPPGETEHLTKRQADDAIVFLRERPADKPFCLSISFKAPHAQDGASREFPPDARDEGLYAGVTVPLMAEERSAAFYQTLPEPVRNSESRTRWARRFATPQMAQATSRDYYRLIAGLDREIGRILDELAARGLADNTVIVFTSDNGFFLGDRGLADKWYAYDESTRVPLVIYDPRHPYLERHPLVDAMTLNVDLAPTLLDFAGIAIPRGMQGKSLRSLLTPVGASAAPWREDFFFDHYTVSSLIPPSEAVRSQRWLYLRWEKPHPLVEELYDLERDPAQLCNVAGEPAYAKVLAAQRDRWKTLRADAGNLDTDYLIKFGDQSH